MGDLRSQNGARSGDRRTTEGEERGPYMILRNEPTDLEGVKMGLSICDRMSCAGSDLSRNGGVRFLERSHLSAFAGPLRRTRPTRRGFWGGGRQKMGGK